MRDDEKYHYLMVGYILENTLTEEWSHEPVVYAETDEDGYLMGIQERTHIEKRPDGTTAYTEDDGATWIMIRKEAPFP